MPAVVRPLRMGENQSAGGERRSHIPLRDQLGGARYVHGVEAEGTTLTALKMGFYRTGQR